MYRKKLTYSFFSIPVAIITYNLHKYHKDNLYEKFFLRKAINQKLNQPAKELASCYDESQNKFPWSEMSKVEMDSSYGYQLFDLTGEFDNANEILVRKLRDGEEGFDVVTPFYCYRDENKKLQPVLVNRGWIPFDNKSAKAHRTSAVGKQTIKGFLYKGDMAHKYSRENDIISDNWQTQKPDEIAIYRLLPNKKVSSQFVIKQVDLNPINKTSLPLVLNKDDLEKFPIRIDENGYYSTLWKAATFFNVFSNVFFWIYL